MKESGSFDQAFEFALFYHWYIPIVKPKHVKQAIKGIAFMFRYREENHVNNAVMAHI